MAVIRQSPKRHCKVTALFYYFSFLKKFVIIILTKGEDIAEEENIKSRDSGLLKFIGVLLIGVAIGLFIASGISASDLVEWFIMLGVLILGVILLVIGIKK